MARTLTFTAGRSKFSAELIKVDRSKLYGSVSIETLDSDGERCDLATLARDGRTLIPYGGTAAGYLNTDGKWVDSNQRQPVDVDGEPLSEVPSSFDAPIQLKQTAAVEDLLDTPIRLAYRLGGAELPAAMAKKLGSGTIYQFGFSYRGGPTADPAFVLTDEDGDLWMLVGEPADVDFISYQKAALCAACDEQDSEDDNDEFDFDML
jgi:hypothetical protein